MPLRGVCRCGTLLTCKRGPSGYKMRCPSCRSVVRIREPEKQRRQRPSQICDCGTVIVLDPPPPACPICRRPVDTPDPLAPSVRPVPSDTPMSMAPVLPPPPSSPDRPAELSMPFPIPLPEPAPPPILDRPELEEQWEFPALEPAAEQDLPMLEPVSESGMLVLDSVEELYLPLLEPVEDLEAAAPEVDEADEIDLHGLRDDVPERDVEPIRRRRPPSARSTMLAWLIVTVVVLGVVLLGAGAWLVWTLVEEGSGG